MGYDCVVWQISTDISGEHQYLSTAQHHRRLTHHDHISVTVTVVCVHNTNHYTFLAMTRPFI